MVLEKVLNRQRQRKASNGLFFTDWLTAFS